MAVTRNEFNSDFAKHKPMLNFDPTDEQALLTSSLNKIILDHYGSDEHSKYLKEKSGFSSKLWNTLAENGFFSLHFPDDVGGLSGSLTDLALVMKELGKGVSVEPVLAGPVLGGLMIDSLGNDNHRSTLLPKIIDGSMHVSLAHSEKKARFQLDVVETKFSKDGDKTTLTGKKMFALGTGMADAFIVSATGVNSANGKSPRIRFFLVQAGAQGIARQDYRLTDGSIASDLSLNNVEAEPLGGDWKTFTEVITKTKVAACAEMVGIMERLFEDTLEYVKTREQFGQPIGKFQVIQHRLADHFASLELCKSHLFRVCDEITSTLSGQKQISGSKSFISQEAMNLAEDAVQFHGGMGITDELIIGRGLKRIMVLSSLFGDAAHERNHFH